MRASLEDGSPKYDAAIRPPKGASVPIVTIQQSPRKVEVKRRLVAGITQAFVAA